MAIYNKFESFVEALCEGKHNFAGDVIKVALCNAANAPVATNSVLLDLTVVSVANLDSVIVTISSSSQTAGTYKAVATDLTMTATGAVGPFRYAVIYNETALNDDLICWYDYASEITLAITDTFKLDFGTELFSLV